MTFLLIALSLLCLSLGLSTQVASLSSRQILLGLDRRSISDLLSATAWFGLLMGLRFNDSHLLYLVLFAHSTASILSFSSDRQFAQDKKWPYLDVALFAINSSLLIFAFIFDAIKPLAILSILGILMILQLASAHILLKQSKYHFNILTWMFASSRVVEVLGSLALILWATSLDLQPMQALNQVPSLAWFTLLIATRTIHSSGFLLLVLLETQLQLNTQASTDPLTGIYNRKVFLDMLEKELSLSRRMHIPVSILALDIDHFKSINDQYGHENGDRTLRAIVSVVSACLRQQDLLCRVGGEEFSIILPATNLNQAHIVASRIRSAVENNSIELESQTIHCTVSIGVVQFNQQEPRSTMIKRADNALYQAKLSRNCVMISPAPGQEILPKDTTESNSEETLLFEWNTELSTGETRIDEQHKLLFHIASKVRQGAVEGYESETIYKNLEELIHYTKVHFADEERFMQENRYPDLKIHHEVHQHLTQRASDLALKYQKGEFVQSTALSQFLGEWIRDHILSHDLKMTRWIQQKATN